MADYDNKMEKIKVELNLRQLELLDNVLDHVIYDYSGNNPDPELEELSYYLTQARRILRGET